MLEDLFFQQQGRNFVQGYTKKSLKLRKDFKNLREIKGFL